jgi:hypothetical protein
MRQKVLNKMDKSSYSNDTIWLSLVESIVKYTYTNGIRVLSDFDVRQWWHIDRQMMFSLFSLVLLFSSLLACSLSLSWSNDNNHHQCSLSLYGIKSYVRNNFYDYSRHCTIVLFFFTFTRLCNRFCTSKLTTTAVAAIAVIILEPMIIGN